MAAPDSQGFALGWHVLPFQGKRLADKPRVHVSMSNGLLSFVATSYNASDDSDYRGNNRTWQMSREPTCSDFIVHDAMREFPRGPAASRHGKQGGSAVRPAAPVSNVQTRYFSVRFTDCYAVVSLQGRGTGELAIAG